MANLKNEKNVRPITESSLVDHQNKEHGSGIDTPIFDRVHSPADLRGLSIDELSTLCAELRQELIHTVSRVGGHFASSLGVVELTVACHKVFDTPHDRIVWDVGHQTYIHKMLTGRRHKMGKVRQFGGISGFPRREESVFDAFGVAHAGTSISAASGMLEASCLKNEERKVVAIIGDGALTAGMAFEALNHSGHLHRNLIVILNDNEMSIAPNVGALSRALSRTLSGKISTTLRRQIKLLVEKGILPRALYRALDKVEEATQGFLSTSAMLFGAFDYRYIGPVDGHDISQIIEVLECARVQDGPVLIHAQTTKGKGYTPAEQDPVKFHGIGPFSLQEKLLTEKPNAALPSYTDVFGEALVEFAQADSRVIGITAAMPDGTGLSYLREIIPERYFDTGIAEQHAVTFAAGMACEGLRPVCAIYSTFLQRAYDQVVHDVCIQSLPVVFAMDRAGLVGADGPTHHGVFDIAFLRTLPNMTIMAPRDAAELRNMLYTAIQHTDGPIAIRYPRGNASGTDIFGKPSILQIGSSEVVRSPSVSDVLILAIGNCVATSLEAAIDLSKDWGIEASVVNARFVKPLDEELLHDLVSKHKLVVTIEDHALMGGFGSAVLEFMAETGLTSGRAIIRLGIEDDFVTHGSQRELYELCKLDKNHLIDRITKALKHSLIEPLPHQFNFHQN